MIKKSKIIKKKNTGKTTENEVIVLLEDIRGQVKIVAEGQEILNDKVDRFRNELKGELSEFKNEMYNFKGEMLDFKRDTESNFKTVFKHFFNIDDELKSIKTEIFELKTMLFKKVDLERLVALEQKVATLERQLAGTKS